MISFSHHQECLRALAYLLAVSWIMLIVCSDSTPGNISQSVASTRELQSCLQLSARTSSGSHSPWTTSIQNLDCISLHRSGRSEHTTQPRIFLALVCADGPAAWITRWIIRSYLCISVSQVRIHKRILTLHPDRVETRCLPAVLCTPSLTPSMPNLIKPL